MGVAYKGGAVVLIDAFSFYNELDILELRLREIGDHVDRIVIVEAPVSHKGDPKPLHFWENRIRFSEWLPKIRHVVVHDMPAGDGLAAIRRREMWQRNAILRGLQDCADDDLVLISDVDEIPRKNYLPQGIHDGQIVAYVMDLYYYNFNTKAQNVRWFGTRACRVADARAMTPHIVRYGIGTPDEHYPHYGLLEGAGWHFSYFGDPTHVAQKMTQFLHQELVTPENSDPAAIAERIARGEDVYGRTDAQQFAIGPASDLPDAVLCHLQDYMRYFADSWAPEFHEDWYIPEQAIYVGWLAHQAPDGALVEIGAWEGRSASIIAQRINPRVLHVVDTWAGNVEEGAQHPSVVAAGERDVLGTFVGNMDLLTASNWQHYWQDWRDWLPSWREPIAFVHIDAAHDAASVADCIRALLPFLVPGAILCGDDAYAKSVVDGVRAVLGDAPYVIGGRLWVWQKEY